MVTATHAGGESAASTEASATPQLPAPGAPADLSLTAGNARVTARWRAVSGATGYTLYYSQSTISSLTAAGVTQVANLTATSATATGLSNGTTYYFVVTATHAGGESAVSTEASATPQATPSAPTDLSLTAGNAQVQASWTAVSNAGRYTLYYSTAPITNLTATEVTRVASLTATSHTMRALTNGVTYYFRITASNAGGQSAASTEASAAPQAPSGAPSGFSLSAGDTQITAGWSTVAGASRYTLYYSQTPFSDLTAAGVTAVPNLTTTSHTVRELTNATTYYFRLTATNAGGQSAASSQASAAPQAPASGAPSGLGLTAGNAQVEARWSAVNNATGYTLYYSTTSLAGTTDFTDASSVTATATSATATGLTNGTRYYFAVTATRVGGESAASSQASATPQGPPRAPTGLSLSAGNTQVSARWNSVGNASTYTLYYSESSISNLTAAGVTAVPNLAATSHTVTALNNGTTYYFKVTATHAGGQGAASAEASAMPQLPPAPDAPAHLSLTAGLGQVAARWSAVAGARTYTLYYSQAPISRLTASGVTAVPDLTGNPHIVTGLSNGTRYYFRVTATNAGGQSAASSQASATPQIPPAGVILRDTLSGGGQGPQMVVLPTGSFRMGSPATEAGRGSDEGPVRTVTINKRIAIGRYEVTFADYDRFVAARSGTRRPTDYGYGRGSRPVISVSRDDAKLYAAWLSTQTGKTYRLPSEAEWEYAARAGTTTAYAFGDTINCTQASYNYRIGDSCTDPNTPMPVGSFAANAFGLYDMHGNVWEWVEDCYVNNYNNAPTDGSARSTGCPRLFGGIHYVYRGGSWWSNGIAFLRSAKRQRFPPSYRLRYVGFRLVRDLDS